MEQKPLSIWQKLKQRKPAFVALCVIGFACLIALFAYRIAPDNSPDANRIIVELGARPPGFSKLFLEIPRQHPAEKKSLFSKVFLGTIPANNLLPINGYKVVGDTVFVSHYIDEGLQDTLHFSLTALNAGKQQKIGDKKLAAPELVPLVKKTFYLGTDRYGRDVLSRLIIGTRVSLAVGIIAVILSLSIGIFLGAVAGYFGGWVDNAVMYLINLLWAIPTILLVFAVTLSIGKGFFQIFIAIGLTMWVGAARLIRGQVLALREEEYIQAAKTLGLSNMRIIFRHILPNIAGPIMVIAAANFAAAILIEAGLSFLGLGVQPPMPSWGLMIKEHYNFLLSDRPILALIPGIAIMILVYAFNILGNALRDVMDVRGD